MTMSENDSELAQSESVTGLVGEVSDASDKSGSISSLQVLLVDDNVTVRDAASEYLKAAGHKVTMASNGFEALARVVQSRPDVVLADITMPRLDGYQVCALLKSNSDYQHIPVIMITGRDGLLDQTRAHLVGSDAHVSKPFTAQALTKAVSEAGQSLQGSGS